MTLHYLAALGLLVLSACTAPAPPPATDSGPDDDASSYPGKALYWSDEFEGETLDTTYWNYLYGTGYGGNDNGWGNNELQYYRAENTTIEDGALVITARRENFEDRKYTSSRLTTDDKREFAFGRWDVRARLPIGRGIWPAIWMLGADFPEGTGWPMCGEIDIMEYLGHRPTTVFGTVHYGSGFGENYRYRGDSTELKGTRPLTDAFHLFSIDWRRDTIDWLVDNERFARFTAADAAASGQPYPFNDPHYLLLNLAVGGDWPGNPDETTQFPQRLEVDYVRLYREVVPSE